MATGESAVIVGHVAIKLALELLARCDPRVGLAEHAFPARAPRGNAPDTAVAGNEAT